MKLAIVGSRVVGDLETAERIIRDVLREYDPELVISGGASGIDTLAEEMAIDRGIQTHIYAPKDAAWYAYKRRNQQIAEACDFLVCIRSRKSKSYGSGWTADYAEKIGKPVERYKID